MTRKLSVSIIVPVYNEAQNVGPLFEELLVVTRGFLDREVEIVFVDDGSTDSTLEELKKLRPCRVLSFSQNYGKSAALHAAFQSVKGAIFVVLDGDRQNDPGDIPRLLEKIDEGWGVAAGWRKERWKEKRLTRRLPSIVANWLISKVSGVTLHDHGCALKAYRREFLKGIKLQDDMQRMLAVRAVQSGAKMVEIPVNYRQRQSGKAKFGSSRILKVPLDLVTLFFFDHYARRPMHFFGGIGLLLGGLSLFVAVCWAGVSLFFQVSMGWIFGAIVVFVFISQFISIGLLAELVVRYSMEKPERYVLKEVLDNH